jgi:hypothetical protein
MNIDQVIQDADPAIGAKVPGPDSPVARQSFERVLAAGQTRSRIPHVGLTIAVAKQGSLLRGTRGKALIGAAVAAVGAAAAATVIAMPSSPAVTVSMAPAVPTMMPAPATLTAAAVLDQAAQAAGSQPGWPNAQYWYTEAQYWCGGRLYTAKAWLPRHGNGVLEKTGPNNGPAVCNGNVTVPISGKYIFGLYTWSQLYALPTDPAKLKPKLIADFGQGSGQALFEDVEDLLTDTPAPPALLEALFKIDASIPGVKVVGDYTDSLGRTGTAIQLGRVTMVVDPANGVVLDETNYGTAVTFVTQGPATTEPKPTRWVW